MATSTPTNTDQPKKKIKKPLVDYTNKGAYSNYAVVESETWLAGIVLKGWEVKCLDNHGGDINYAYCRFINGKLYVINFKISPTSHEYAQQITTKDMLADRPLLLNKSELKKVKALLDLKGYTSVPLKLYRNNKYLWKMKICVAKPLKNYDKRIKLKEKDIARFEQRQAV